MESILFFVFWLTKVDSKFKRVYVKFILWWQYDHCSTVHQTPDQDSHASHTRTENNEWVSTWRSYFINLHTLRLVGGALWRLTEFHVLLQEHESSELLQHGLDCVVPRPPGQDRHRPHVHHAVAGHAVHVDPVDEPHGRGLVGVVVPALCTATMWTFTSFYCLWPVQCACIYQFWANTSYFRRLFWADQWSCQSNISSQCHPRFLDPSYKDRG